MEKQISIIIPTYNMEKYLGKCLDSLLIPEFDQVEVLVVNDGSKDRSSEIAHEYANRYPESIRVIDKENGGHGSCCNIGLSEATGRYVRFLDSDDWFDTKNFQKFLSRLQKSESDLIITPFNYAYTDGSVKPGYLSFKGLDGTVNLNPSFWKQNCTFCVYHTGTFKTENLRKCGIVFSEKCMYDDTILHILPFRKTQTIEIIDFPVYNYLIGRPGQTIADPTPKAIRFRIQELEKMVRNYASFRDELSISYKVFCDMATIAAIEDQFYSCILKEKLTKFLNHYKYWRRVINEFKFIETHPNAKAYSSILPIAILRWIKYNLKR